MKSICCLCLCIPSIDFLNAYLMFRKLRIYAMAPERISKVINSSYQSATVCLSPIIARQRFGRRIPAATNTRYKEKN